MKTVLVKCKIEEEDGSKPCITPPIGLWSMRQNAPDITVVDLNIEPEDGFGDYDEQQVFLESRQHFPPELEEGMTFDGHAMPAGCSPDIPSQGLYTVTEIYPEHVVLDGNHPLAGIGLRLSLQVASVREASEEETARGSTGSGFFQIQAD